MNFSEFATKADLVDYAASLDPPLDLPMSMTRAEQEEALAAHMAQDAPEKPAQADDGAPAITITRSPMTPVSVALNGVWLTLPVGRRVRVPANVLPVLTGAGVEYEVH